MRCGLGQQRYFIMTFQSRAHNEIGHNKSKNPKINSVRTHIWQRFSTVTFGPITSAILIINVGLISSISKLTGVRLLESLFMWFLFCRCWSHANKVGNSLVLIHLIKSPVIKCWLRCCLIGLHENQFRLSFYGYFNWMTSLCSWFWATFKPICHNRLHDWLIF